MIRLHPSLTRSLLVRPWTLPLSHSFLSTCTPCLRLNFLLAEQNESLDRRALYQARVSVCFLACFLQHACSKSLAAGLSPTSSGQRHHVTQSSACGTFAAEAFGTTRAAHPAGLLPPPCPLPLPEWQRLSRCTRCRYGMFPHPPKSFNPGFLEPDASHIVASTLRHRRSHRAILKALCDSYHWLQPRLRLRRQGSPCRDGVQRQTPAVPCSAKAGKLRCRPLRNTSATADEGAVQLLTWVRRNQATLRQTIQGKHARTV